MNYIEKTIKIPDDLMDKLNLITRQLDMPIRSENDLLIHIITFGAEILIKFGTEILLNKIKEQEMVFK